VRDLSQYIADFTTINIPYTTTTYRVMNYLSVMGTQTSFMCIEVLCNRYSSYDWISLFDGWSDLLEST